VPICPVPKIPKTGTQQETERQLKVLRQTANRLLSDPAKAKKFFVAHGFNTPTGKVAARYRATK